LLPVLTLILADPLVRTVNVGFDPSPPREHRVVVLDRHVSHHNSGSGTRSRRSVSKMYQSTKVGDEIVLTSHAGLLRTEWLVVSGD